jgi:hypothetical protein
MAVSNKMGYGGGPKGATLWRVRWRWIGGGDTTRHHTDYIAMTRDDAQRAWERDYECRMTYELVTIAPSSEVRRPQVSPWQL